MGIIRNLMEKIIVKYNLNTKHIISIRDLSKEDFVTIMSLTGEIKADPEKFRKELDGKILSLCFFEPSTRTYFSFESAMLRLGGKTIGFAGTEGTSVKKGEVLYDTIQMMGGYSDIIVLRHGQRGSGQLAAKVSPVPIISGGSGSQEHPTQALLDSFTMLEHFKKLDNLKVGIMGDLKYGRTIPSLVYALAKYDNNKIYAISHELLRMSKEVKYDTEKLGIEIIETEEFNSDIIKELDVLYVTRVQRERFTDDDLYMKVRGKYIVNPDILKDVKKNFIVMHPLPRVNELTFEVDKLPQAKYFIQAKNGVYTRMAILLLLLKGEINV